MLCISPVLYYKIKQKESMYLYERGFWSVCSSHWGLQLNFSPSAVGEDALFSLPTGQTSHRISKWTPHLNIQWETESLWQSKHIKDSWQTQKKTLDMIESVGESWKKTSSSTNYVHFLKSLHISPKIDLRFKDYISSFYWLHFSVEMKAPPQALEYLLCWMIKLLF